MLIQQTSQTFLLTRCIGGRLMPEVRDQLADYLAGVVSASELEDSLEELTWEEQGLDPVARHLANEALRLLAEHANGDWTDDELTDRLGSLVHAGMATLWHVHHIRVTGQSYVAERSGGAHSSHAWVSE